MGGEEDVNGKKISGGVGGKAGGWGGGGRGGGGGVRGGVVGVWDGGGGWGVVWWVYGQLLQYMDVEKAIPPCQGVREERSQTEPRRD